MSAQPSDKIIVFYSEVDSVTLDEGPTPADSIVGGLKKLVRRHKEIPQDLFYDNAKKFIAQVQKILAESVQISGDYSLDTVEVNAEISANGQIGFMGTGVGITGKGGIKFVFKRSASQGKA
jgi:hypothetical protein